MPKIARAGPPTQAEADSRAAILDAADRQLRRFGPEKLTVLDIAREAGMSHPNLYRFFAAKTDILDAVVARWLGDVEAPLAGIAAGPGSAAARIEDFLLTQHRIKARKVAEEAEMFRCYGAMLGLAGRDAIAAHQSRIQALLARIVREGVAAGEFAAGIDAEEAAATLREATLGFTSPTLLPAVLAAGDAEGRMRRVLRLLVAGLRG